MPKAFFLDYGSESEYPDSIIYSASENYKALRQENIKKNNNYYCKLDVGFFKFRHSEYSTVIVAHDSFQIVIHQYGITHRSIEITLRDDASEDDKTKFTTLEDIAKNIIVTKYDLMHFNCVTAVSKILAFIEPSITAFQTDLVWPATLDKLLKNHLKKLLINDLNNIKLM